MKVLLDTCVWGGVREVLIRAGYEVDSTASWPEDPGDLEILAYTSVSGLLWRYVGHGHFDCEGRPELPGQRARLGRLVREVF